MTIITSDLSTVPAPSVTIRTTGGVPYIACLRANGETWRMLDPGKWCEVDLFNLSTKATTTLGADDFTYVVSGTTVTATGIAPYTSIVLTFTLTATDDGYAFAVSAPAHSTGKGLEAIRWPYLKVAPRDSFYCSWPAGPGVVIKDPHAAGVTHAAAMPGAPQFIGFVDGGSKSNLYVSSDDDDGNLKVWQLSGDGDGATIFLTHVPNGGHHTANLGYTQPFGLTVEAFRGTAALPWVDAAMRYRLAAVAPGRPWTAYGKWRDSSYNQRAATSNLVVVHHGDDYADADTAVNELTKLKTYLNPGTDGKIIQLYYDWGNDMDHPPDYANGSALRADWTDMVDDLDAAGIYTTPYVFVAGWSEGNTSGTYDIATVPAHTFLQRSNGTTYYGEETAGSVVRQWDFDHASVPAVIAATVAQIGSEIGAHPVHGFYVDAWQLHDDPQHDSTRSAWTFALQNAGRIDSYQGIVTTLQAGDASAFTMTEWPDEHLVGTADIVFTSSLSGYTAGYPTSGAFADVFGELQRIASFDGFITSASDVSRIPLVTDISDYGWHQGGMMGYNSNVAATGLVTTALIADTALYPLFTWFKTLQTAWPTVKPYMSGRRMRPACVASELARIDAQDLDDVWFQANGLDYQVQASTWQDIATGNIGVVLTHHWPDGVYDEVASQTVRLRFVSRDYGITAQEKTVRKTVGAGSPTTIGTMTAAGEFDVTIAPGTVVLVEVVLPTTAPVTYPVA